MNKIDFNKWVEITQEEYMDIGDEDVIKIMSHHHLTCRKVYYFKRLKK